MATSEEVAQLAGVSRATVSRALNGSPRISAEARKRVYAAVSQLGYEPDVIAQSLVRQRSNVLAVSLFPEEHKPPFSSVGQSAQYFYLSVLRSIEQATIALGYDLLLPSYQYGEPATNYIRSLRTRRVAGCIMLTASDARMQALTHSNIPTVFIDRMSQGPHTSYVKTDHVDAARQAVEYLLSLGHRRIAFLPGCTVELAGLERLLGCQQALAQVGITADPVLIRPSGWNIDEAYETANILLNERRDFTAIVAGSDLMAVGVLRALQEHNLRVPADISLIGFDDVDFAQYTNPSLTTMRQDHEAIGQGAVQRLIALVNGSDETSPLILPGQLIVRKSTGPVPLVSTK